MAENESLDLGKARRWHRVLQAVIDHKPADQIASLNRNIVPLLVRHSGQGKLVKQQISAINAAMNANLNALILPFWMRSPESIGFREEASQRTRSFLFCATAGVAAGMVEARAIEMMENGR